MTERVELQTIIAGLKPFVFIELNAEAGDNYPDDEDVTVTMTTTFGGGVGRSDAMDMCAELLEQNGWTVEPPAGFDPERGGLIPVTLSEERLAEIEAVAVLYPTSTSANEPGRILAEETLVLLAEVRRLQWVCRVHEQRIEAALALVAPGTRQVRHSELRAVLSSGGE